MLQEKENIPKSIPNPEESIDFGGDAPPTLLDAKKVDDFILACVFFQFVLFSFVLVFQEELLMDRTDANPYVRLRKSL